MTVDLREFLLHVELEAEVVETWLDAGWLCPARDDAAFRFSDVDLARARLICDLKHDLGVNDEAVPIILDLLDQVHGLRRRMSALRRALAEGSEAGSEGGSGR
jgi:chaperone modulatory protein CbpM